MTIGQTQTIVTYDRPALAYKIKTRHNGGLVATAPDRRSADWAQLTEELGEAKTKTLRQLAARHPQLTTRIMRAGIMYACELCGPVDWDDPNVYRVRSQSQSTKKYRVYIPADRPQDWTCTVIADPLAASRYQHPCPDIANTAPTVDGHGKRCKHMILAALHRVWIWKPWSEERTPRAPEPAADEPDTLPQKPDITIARYANGGEVQPGDLCKFAAFVGSHRRLPMNRAACI